MTSTAEQPNRVAALSRSRVAVNPLPSFGSPSSPYTPTLQRPSSLYGSPGGGFRSSDEEYVIFEFGTRFLRAGFNGESSPRCTLTFGPEDSRKLGDYRRWMPNHATKRKKVRLGKAWGSEYELWRMDLRETDLGLVEDKLERALRDTYNKYFLLDKPRRVILALPPLLPRALLSAVLNVFFNHFQPPSVSLLSSPIMSTVAAGLRSALIVDIGWAETTVTAVYEYREVLQRRSVRAGKRLSREMAKLLDKERTKSTESTTEASQKPEPPTTFEEAEEVLCRLGWCMSRVDARKAAFESHRPRDISDDDDPLMTIPMPAATPPRTLEVPFSHLAEPAEIAIFGKGTESQDMDSHDQPLHLLVYGTLLALAVVTRDICMARIVITGGVSNLPGVKGRVVEELETLIHEKGWNRVRSYGASADGNGKLVNSSARGVSPRDEERPGTNNGAKSRKTAALSSELADKPHATLVKEAERELIAEREAPIAGRIRCVESLGAWAGASLVANLRIKGAVEIEREKFLQHGPAGSTTTSQEKAGAAHTRQTLGMGTGPRQSIGERTSWNLGVWA